MRRTFNSPHWVSGLAFPGLGRLARGAAVGVLALAAAARGGEARRGTLVELFTSQGCSSCPAAEALLNRVEEISPSAIALAFHVDYWDRLGWKDPFSRPEWTARQGAYADRLGERSVYTPQAVVAGRVGFVGSSRGQLSGALASARPAEAEIGLACEPSADGKRLKIKATIRATAAVVAAGDPGARESGGRDLYLALAENGLKTVVPRGENAGRTLEGNHVVRALRRVGSVKPAAGAPAEAEAELEIPEGANPARLEVVAFLRNPADLSVVAAAVLEVAGERRR